MSFADPRVPFEVLVADGVGGVHRTRQGAHCTAPCDSRGVPAFARLFYHAEEATDTAFRFRPMPNETIAEQPQTIDRTAQQLLLSAAVDLEQNETDGIVLVRRRMAAESDRSETEPGHDAPE